jgi:pre-rRNA-processing protein TSR1
MEDEVCLLFASSAQKLMFSILRAERFKTSIQFINVPYQNFYAALDACKVADYAIFVLSATVEVDQWGDTLLRTLQAQGLPDVVSVVPQNSIPDAKSRSGILKSLLSFMQYFIPSQSRVFDLHVSSDRLNALRALAEGKPGDLRWREGRTWLLGETTSWQDGSLKVTGTVRGAALSANRLMHLPDHGDFQVLRVGPPLYYQLSSSHSHRTDRVCSISPSIKVWGLHGTGSRCLA